MTSFESRELFLTARELSKDVIREHLLETQFPPVQTANVALGLGVVIPPHLAYVTDTQWFPLTGQFCRGSHSCAGHLVGVLLGQ